MYKPFVRGLVGAVCAIVTIGSLSVLAIPSNVLAVAGSGSGQGLEISPPVIEVSGDPGQTITMLIRIRNVTQGTLIVKGVADDFGAGSDETGQPKLLLNETGASRFSLKYWMGGIPDLTLAPGELKTNTIRIALPANAEPGGHYGVVRFTGVPPTLQSTGVSLAASVGTLVLMRVNGQVTDKLTLQQFGIGAQSQKGTWLEETFFEHGPVGFLVRLNNGGTVHEKAKGAIIIKNALGGKAMELNVNPTGGNVLPDSIRRFTQTLDQKQLFGRYTATLSLTYAGDKHLSGKLSFWVIPWKLILLVLAGLVVLFYILKLGIKRYNEHVIAMARRR